MAVCGLVAAYAAIAADLPSPEALRSHAATFVSTRIYDRNGHLLYEIFDPNGGRRTLVPYEQISPHLINATVATEDERFWQHPGVDPIGILRAVLLQRRRSGASSPGPAPSPSSWPGWCSSRPRSATEQSCRARSARRFWPRRSAGATPSSEILEIYLNEINYGNLAYGIERRGRDLFWQRGQTI